MRGSLLLAWMALTSVQAAASPDGDSAWKEARRRVELTWRSVQVMPRARGEASERRAADVMSEGYKLFGSSFNTTEAAAILALMGDWLRQPRQAADTDALLVQAAKASHPEIGDGHAMRSARNWAAFVDVMSGSPGKAAGPAR